MNHRRMLQSCTGSVMGAIGLLVAAAMSWAAPPQPPKYQLQVKDINGATVAVPQADRATVVLFLRINQDQSRRTIENVKKALAWVPESQVVVVLSGQQDPDMVKVFAGKFPWPLVLDPEYAIVGQCTVRVWPTCLVVLPDGRELTRLTGLPESQETDLNTWMAFATGKIDQATRDKRLGAAGIVADNANQMAMRHLSVAERLLDQDQIQQARLEIIEGLRLQPKDERLLLTKARILLLLGTPDEALDVLDRLDDRSSLAAKMGVLKGGALVALKRWQQAVNVLEVAVKLNPDPADAQYFLGVAYEALGKHTEATKAYRLAFEGTPHGRIIAGALKAPDQNSATTQPATQPATRSAPKAVSSNSASPAP